MDDSAAEIKATQLVGVEEDTSPKGDMRFIPPDAVLLADGDFYREVTEEGDSERRFEKIEDWRGFQKPR
jgi:hypothetical protein